MTPPRCYYCTNCKISMGASEAILHQDRQHRVENLEVAADEENLEEAKK